MTSAIPKELEGVLVSTPDTLHGGVRFKGTRVFGYQLFDYVLNGRTLDEFLADFEGVSRDQATALMSWELRRVREQLDQAS